MHKFVLIIVSVFLLWFSVIVEAGSCFRCVYIDNNGATCMPTFVSGGSDCVMGMHPDTGLSICWTMGSCGGDDGPPGEGIGISSGNLENSLPSEGCSGLKSTHAVEYAEFSVSSQKIAKHGVLTQRLLDGLSVAGAVAVGTEINVMVASDQGHVGANVVEFEGGIYRTEGGFLEGDFFVKTGNDERAQVLLVFDQLVKGDSERGLLGQYELIHSDVTFTKNE